MIAAMSFWTRGDLILLSSFNQLVNVRLLSGIIIYGLIVSVRGRILGRFPFAICGRIRR